MSLLFPDQLRIGLGASYAVLAKVSGHKVAHWRMQTWDSTDITATPWERALSAISGWLAEMKPHRLSVIVTLSGELAPLHLLPWREDVASSEKQALLAQSNFRRIYGEVAAHWEATSQPTGYGQPWLASAVDQHLMSALKERLIGVKLASVMPLSLSFFNALQHQLSDNTFWLLVPEQEKLTAIYCQNQEWKLVRTLPISALKHEPIKKLLTREIKLAGLIEQPSKIYAASAKSSWKEVSSINPGWKSEEKSLADAPFHLLGAGL
ncbi:MAG: hypothetical protein LAC70_00240 [Methylovulum sp.]|nr:hypothetical protein [Methylovulum sp.]